MRIKNFFFFLTIQATIHDLVLIQGHCSRIPKILSFESLDGVAFFFWCFDAKI